MTFDVDVVVIGGGAAGLTASQLLSTAKKKVVLVEKERTGGECLYTGCIPSKTLLSVAREVHTARQAHNLGLHFEGELDWNRVKGRLQRAIRKLEEKDSPHHLQQEGVEVMHGTARFLAPHTVEVVQEGIHKVMRARHFILASGSKVVLPPIEGLRKVPFLTHETVFNRAEKPAHLLIVGGGALGCEMAQAFVRLGSQVTLLQKTDRLLPHDEPEASEFLLRVLQGEGVTVHLQTGVTGVEQHGETLTLTLQDESTIQGSHLLIATGKGPRVQGLGLETLGAAFDETGLTVREDMRSVSCPYLFGAGDVTGGPMFTHVATEQGTLAALGCLGRAGNLAAHFRAPAARGTSIPWVTFVDPEIAHWGLTEWEAREKHGPRVEVVHYGFDQLDRAVTEGKEGFIKLVGLRGAFGTPLGMRLLGVQVVGPRAGELIHLISSPARLGFHPLKLALLPHSYPTYAEAARLSTLGFFASGHAFGSKKS